MLAQRAEGANPYAYSRSAYMGNPISYSNYVIRTQSFELVPSGGWIPRFTLACPERGLLCRDRLDKAFPSKDKADEFALEDAINWIDNHDETVARSMAPSP
jgi:hypothetical protein